jgi:hypothetical protein
MARAPAVPSESAVGLANVSPQARALFRPGMTRREFATRLVEAGLLEDATGFFGCLVPCHAVWWACLCLWKLLGPRMSAAQRDRFRVAARWALEPNAEHHRAAETLSKQVNDSDPIYWVLLAAAHAGSSASVDRHPNPIDTEGVARAAETAVRLAVAALPEADRQPALQHCIRLGFDIAGGGCPRVALLGARP